MKKRKYFHARIIVALFIVATSVILILRISYDVITYQEGNTIEIRGESRTGYDYLLRFPPGYTDFGGKRPLLVYLHGAGEVGKDVNILRNMDVYAYAMNMNLHGTKLKR